MKDEQSDDSFINYKQFLMSHDLFGHQVGFTFKNHGKEFHTRWGGVCSLCVKLLFVLLVALNILSYVGQGGGGFEHTIDDMPYEKPMLVG